MAITIESSSVVSADGTPIALHHLVDSGATGDPRPPLVLSHATGFHGRAYLPMARVLIGRFDIWALDYRAHGASAAPESGDMHWARMGEDLQAVLAHIGEPVFAIGHSMGGAAIAISQLVEPGLIRAAWMFEPIVFPAEFLAGPDKSALSASARRRREIFDSRADALSRYASRPPLDRFRSDSLWSYVEYGFDDLADGTVQLSCRGADEAETFEADKATSVEGVNGLGLAAVIACGRSEGEFSPADIAPLVSESMPNASLVTYPQLTHFGPFEDPELIAEAAATFFASVQ